MKRLEVFVDGRRLFEGEVAEFQWSESDGSVTLTGKFKPSPTILQALASAAAARREVNQNDSPAIGEVSYREGQRPILDVVREDGE